MTVLDHRENGGVGPDAHSKRHYGNHSDAGALPPHANGLPEIVQEEHHGLEAP
jgi:hypothetical protein